MKLIETKRTYQDDGHTVDIERYKGRENITVWDKDRSLIATFESIDQANNFIQSLTAALVADVSVDNIINK